MILVTLFIIVGTLLLGDFVRNSIINKLIPGDSLTKSLALDVILTFELCGSSFEMGVIFQHYGLTLWSAGVFLTSFFQLIRWRGLEIPSTHTHLIDWIR